MTHNRFKIPADEARQELRQLAKDLNFEMCQLSAKVNQLKALLYGEASEIRREARDRGHQGTADAITVLHGPEGRSTRKGHGQG